MSKYKSLRKLIAHGKQYFPYWLKIKLILMIIKRLYAQLPTYTLSKFYRKTLTKDNPDFIYGELNITDFLFLIDYLPGCNERHIVDLGCGDGKLLVAAGLYCNKTHLTGIEVVPDLAQSAILIAKKLENTIKKSQNTLQILQADFLNETIENYTHIYVNAAALSHTTWNQLRQKLLSLRAGTWIISVERKLGDDCFCLYDVVRCKGSWGNALVNLYQKI